MSRRPRTAPGAPFPSSRRAAAIVLTAAALHAAFDAVTYRLPWTAPPYLRLQDAPEAFRTLSPVAVSLPTSIVGGVIALIAVAALEPRHRRAATLGAVITGFWLLSAALMRVVWLSTPWSVTLVALLAGVPRGFAIGWCVGRIAGRAGVSASRAGAA